MENNALFRIADALTQFGFLALIQSSILVLMAFGLVALFRVRNAAVLSIVYRCLLAAVIVAPMTTMTLTNFRVSGWWPFEWHSKATSYSSRKSDNARQVNELAFGINHSEPEMLLTKESHGSVQNEFMPTTNTVSSERLTTRNTPNRKALPQASLARPSSPAVSGPLPNEITRANAKFWPTMKLVLMWLWLGGTTMMLIRLFRSHRALWQSLELATPTHRSIQSLCDRLAEQLHVRSPRVVHSPYFSSPFLAGVLNSVIHLPDEFELDLVRDDGPELSDVLIHELAHLKRRDALMRLVHQFVLALFFFQPLLWYLVRRLENVAEDVCDDYAVTFGAERNKYANCLVSLAERSDFPIVAAIGIASGNSMLRHRVTRILDASRDLSTRASRRYLAAAGVGTVCLVLATGMLMTPATRAVAQPAATPQERPARMQSDLEKATDNKFKTSEQENSARKKTDSDEGSNIVRGTILGSQGPLSSAEVYWWRSRVHDIDPMTPVKVVTDEQGQFELERSNPNPGDPAIWDMREEMLVRAPGYAFKRTSPLEFARQAESASGFAGVLSMLAEGFGGALQLAPEGTPIQGCLVDIEGQPIEGARVRIRWFTESRSRSLLETEKQIEAERIREVANLINVIEHVPMRNAMPMATTDADGRFDLKGLPERSLFELLVERKGIESMDFVVRNFGGDEVVTVPQAQGFEHNQPTKVYPANFQAAIGPSRTVAGTVTDSQTLKPISGAVVRTTHVHGQRVTSSRERQHLATRTDAQGRYQITGLPIGEDNELVVFTTGDVPYMPAHVKADTSKLSTADAADVNWNIELKPGIWAEGRAYDEATGEPFQGEIHYYWFRNRELEEQYPGVLRAYLDGRYFTDDDGRYRIPVLPTAGVIAFSTGNRNHERMAKFPRGYGEHELLSYRDPEGGFPYYKSAPTSLMPGNYNRLALVKPEADQRTVAVDLPLLATDPIPVAIFDPDGSPANRKMEIYGGNERRGWQDKSTHGFVVEDLLPKQRRKVFAFDRQRNLVGGTIVDLEEGKRFEIHLAPAGRVRGRLLDRDGQPITDATLSIEYGDFQKDDSTAIWARQKGKDYMPSELTIDEQGRFEVFGLSADWKYTARASHRRKDYGRIFGYPFRDLVVQPNENRDLGDIVIEVDK